MMMNLVENRSTKRNIRANKVSMQSQNPNLLRQKKFLDDVGVPLSTLKFSKYKLIPGSRILTSLPCNTEFETPWTLLLT